MAKNLGTFSFAANFEIKTAEALDPRMVAASKADLIKKENWPSDGDTIYVYKGLIVDCGKDGIYRLIDESKVLNDDFSGWEKIDSQNKQDKIESGSNETPHLIWTSDNWKPGKIQIKDIVPTENNNAGNVLTATETGDVIWSSVVTITDKGNIINTENQSVAEYYEISTGAKSIDIYSKQGVDELLKWNIINN